MFLDASAMVAIVARESDADTLADRLGQAAGVYTSPIAICESILGLVRRGNMSISAAATLLDGFLEQTAVRVTPIAAEIGREAVAAFAPYGRGRHPAALNMGDCFAYACARSLGRPLLFKGEDFPQTDIAAA